MHDESHPLAGQTVTVLMRQGPIGKVDPERVGYRVEDWWDKLTGGSWMFADGNPAALNYAMRSGLSGLPTDDEVVYGKIGSFGHLIHVTEIEEASAVSCCCKVLDADSCCEPCAAGGHDSCVGPLA